MPPSVPPPFKKAKAKSCLILSAAIISWILIFSILLFIFSAWFLLRIKFTEIAGYYVTYPGEIK